MKNVAIVFFFYSTIAFPIFDRDRASYAAQKGDWETASSLLAPLTVDDPDKPDLLYDSGVAAFKRSVFEQSESYFKNVTKLAHASDELKEKAYFNCGNSCVELKKLQDAIDNYESALTINPDNEKTKHNLEVVKKMLENQSDSEKSTPDKQQQNQDDKNDNQQGKSDKNNSDQNQSDKQNNDQRKSDSGLDEKKQQEEGKNNRNNQEREQSDQGNERKQEQHSSDKFDSDQNKQKQDDKANHGGSPDRNKEDNSSQQPQDKQETGQGQDKSNKKAKNGGAERYDKQVLKILEAIEKEDAQANKKMMAVQVQQAAGKYDKNQNNY